MVFTLMDFLPIYLRLSYARSSWIEYPKVTVR